MKVELESHAPIREVCTVDTVQCGGVALQLAFRGNKRPVAVETIVCVTPAEACPLRNGEVDMVFPAADSKYERTEDVSSNYL